MRSQVIPAQITTVEDKIAGSLNLTQILLLMVIPLWATAVYTLLPPRLELPWYKLPIIMAVSLVSLILAVRIKGKVVLSWVTIILRYNLRPKYYLFNKNETYLRDLSLPNIKKKEEPLLQKQEKANNAHLSLGADELARLETLIGNPRYSLSLKSNKKGGLRVAFEQNQK